MEFSGSVSSKYTGLLEKFDEETIDARYRSIMDRMNAWISEHNFQNNSVTIFMKLVKLHGV